MFHMRILIALPFLALFAVIPETGKVLDDVRRSVARAAWGEDVQRWSELAEAHSGEDRIPGDAREVLGWLRESGVASYELSEGWKKIYAYQRIVEGAWPIRLLDRSEWRVIRESEALPLACRELKRGVHGALVHCR